MTWGAPEWLRLLVLPGAGWLLLLAMRLARQRADEARWPGIRRVFAAGARVLAVPPRRTIRRPWLLVLASALLIVALARPRWGEIERPVFQQAREVMLALDLSRSMLVEDVSPNRLSRARLLVRGLLDGLRGERVGLIVFAGTAFVQVPLSADYQILDEFLPELNPRYMPQGGTDYAGMLRAAAGGFSDTANTDRYLVVLSDGEALDEEWRSQLPELARRRARVIALGIGTAAGGFIPDERSGYVKDERGAVVLSRLESGTLRALAAETGGVYRDASLWVDLAAVLRETVARGRRGEFTEERSVERVERFQWFLAAAAVVAALGLWREIGIRPRARNIGRGERPRPPATGRQPRAAANPAPTAAFGAAGLALLLALLPAPGAPAGPGPAPDAADPTPAARVRETVTRLAEAPVRRAPDWRELAERTLAYGNGLRQGGQPVAPGAVLDALAAVDAGEALDAHLADWEQLRSDLEKLLEPPPEPEQKQKPPPDQQDKQDQQDKNQEKGGDQDQQQQQPQQDQEGEGESKRSNDSGQGDQPPREDKEGKAGGPGEEDRSQEPKPGDGKRSPEDENGRENRDRPPQPPPQEGRMGELAEDSGPQDGEAEPSPPEKPTTRKIGGRPAGDQPPPSSPEMAAALQRLRQATEDDSPARLFELLEGESTDKKARAKDW